MERHATTVNAEFTTTGNTGCDLQIIPGKIHRLLSFAAPLKGFMLIGEKKTVFTRDDAPVWGTDGFSTLLKVKLGDRIIIALVLVNPLALNPGSFDVTVGDCLGTMEIEKI